jgi:hypothetical protein
MTGLLPATIHNNPTIQTAEKIKVTTGQQSQNVHGRETEGLDRTTQQRKKNWQHPGESVANPRAEASHGLGWKRRRKLSRC